MTARMLSVLLRRPNPTSMSEPGQSDGLRIADPAAMQRTIAMSAHARVEASTVRQQSAMFCQIILLIIALEEWDESMRASAGERAARHVSRWPCQEAKVSRVILIEHRERALARLPPRGFLPHDPALMMPPWRVRKWRAFSDP